jgi:hypothetical protein
MTFQDHTAELEIQGPGHIYNPVMAKSLMPPQNPLSTSAWNVTPSCLYCKCGIWTWLPTLVSSYHNTATIRRGSLVREFV